MTPSFSIIVSNYNYEAHVGAAIASACAQTWDAVEVIVVDDGSTDGSREVISRFPSIKTIFQANGGQSSAIRAGLAIATGDIVITLDADDELVPQTCERVAALWREDTLAVFWRLRTFGLAQFSGEILPRYPYETGDLSTSFLDTGSLVYPPASGNALARDLLERIFSLGIGLTRASHDTWMCFSAAITGRVVTTDEILGRYRIHEKNLSQPGRARKISAVLLDVWYALKAQETAFAVAASYGMPVERPKHLIGAYYLLWYFLLRDAKCREEIPRVPLVSGVLTGLSNFAKLRSISTGQKIKNMIALVVFAVSPRFVRRLFAQHWYHYVDDVGF